jgi:hypothetical protein
MLLQKSTLEEEVLKRRKQGMRGKKGEGQACIRASIKHTNRVKENSTLFTICLLVKEFFV